ncbi:UNKNOWN [Stylonychia lemnae]|uniref:Mitochondrial carrier protein n=1 Tax=Stylonychia lemnae TaxID=5949 RepID=A0A078B772_STYLE|nr:UNKNOWN [Stylonychia lemnae]|eukprot:CDW89152.1 UNKNOWN [Stylonychia lemnae]
MIAGTIANSIFFYVYSDGKKRYNYDPKQPYSLKTIFISMRAGLVSMFLTTPMWTIKTRLALFKEQTGLPSYLALQNIIQDMYRHEGIKGFYRGFLPSIFLSVYGIIQMFSYENINHLLGYNQSSQKKDMWIPFFTGGFSKCFASVALLPMNVVRMRLQMKNYTVEQIKQLNIETSTNYKEQIHYNGVIDCFRKIYKYEGIPAFYKGLTPLVAKVFPGSGVFFVAYESTLRLLEQKQSE